MVLDGVIGSTNDNFRISVSADKEFPYQLNAKCEDKWFSLKMDDAGNVVATDLNELIELRNLLDVVIAVALL